MISFVLICKSKNWHPRVKKINILLKKILKYKNDLNFNNNINYNCNIILGDNKLIKKMNFKFRKIKKNTDVLTFVSKVNIYKSKEKKICDIFFSGEIIKRDAIKNKINFYDHLQHLLIHSFLHINGFKHKKLKDFNRMKKIEITTLNKIGIKNPYLEN